MENCIYILYKEGEEEERRMISNVKMPSMAHLTKMLNRLWLKEKKKNIQCYFSYPYLFNLPSLNSNNNLTYENLHKLFSLIN